MMEHDEKLSQLKALGRLMDSQFRGPWGIKFGLDPIIGLLPGHARAAGTRYTPANQLTEDMPDWLVRVHEQSILTLDTREKRHECPGRYTSPWNGLRPALNAAPGVARGSEERLRYQPSDG
jgi:hypothetical protein